MKGFFSVVNIGHALPLVLFAPGVVFALETTNPRFASGFWNELCPPPTPDCRSPRLLSVLPAAMRALLWRGLRLLYA